MNHSDTKPLRIVILGGGFGGVYCARYLRRYAPHNVEIELINATNYFVFQPLLPEVASGIISAPDAVTSLRLLLPGVKVRMAEVRDIDLENRWVHIVQGSKRYPLKVDYHHLVIALGQKTDLSRFPGFEEHSRTMRDLADAHGLRNHIIQCMEHADITEDEELKRRLLTFVVAGGGFSGVETMGEVMEMVRRTLKHYPNIQGSEVRGLLVQRGQRILPELPEKLGEYALKKLQKRGVDVLLGTSLKSATATAVFLDNGERIEASTLVTTVGNGPLPIIQRLGVDLVRGKIPTDAMLRVSGYNNVWALGDAALVKQAANGSTEPDIAPPTAQFAAREAKCVARNLAATLMEKTLQPFHYRPLGALASLGNYQGVAEIAGVRVSGLLAWLLWRGAYISMLPGFSTRLRVALNWLFDYFLPRNIVQISNREHSAAQFYHYAKGDIVCKAGQLIDGFYAVVDGALESRVPDAAMGEDFVRLIGPGDHWGERCLVEDLTIQGTLVALEHSRVLVLKKSDFTNICAALPVVDQYFKGIPEKIYPHSLRPIRRADHGIN
ncbi:MAG: FAD-dependent oxidoreductase [Halioglobus sp.]